MEYFESLVSDTQRKAKHWRRAFIFGKIEPKWQDTAWIGLTFETVKCREQTMRNYQFLMTLRVKLKPLSAEFSSLVVFKAPVSHSSVRQVCGMKASSYRVS